MAEASQTPLALYVHWPFCLSKCPYCDFNSHVAQAVDHNKWADAMVRELHHYAERAQKQNHTLNSIFFGGGTPSLMAPETMAKIITAARDIFTIPDDIEITMEANPTSVEAERLKLFHDAGANRLSMGIQSLKADGLQYLGREHSAEEALKALDHARQIFNRVSADFIYARTNQTPDEWRNELHDILALGLDHLSLYQLTLEPGTAFYSRHQRGLLDVPDADDARKFYDLTQDMTVAAGCSAYEISNHAKPGQESRHNLIYWQAYDWLGIGPGAYGRFWLGDKRMESRSRRDPAAWLDDVMRQDHAIDHYVEDNMIDFAHEALMMGMRLHQGVHLNRITDIAGPISGWGNEKAMEQLITADFITMENGYLRLTDQGRPLLNTVLEHLTQKHSG